MARDSESLRFLNTVPAAFSSLNCGPSQTRRSQAMHIVPTLRGCAEHNSQASTWPWATPSLWRKDSLKLRVSDKDEHNVPGMCFWTEISKRRFTCRTTSTKYTSGRTGSLPIPCAASTAVWMLDAFFNKFWFFTTNLIAGKKIISINRTEVEGRKKTKYLA